MDDEDYADNSDGGGMSDMEEYDPDAPSAPVAAAASESKTGSLELEKEAAELKGSLKESTPFFSGVLREPLEATEL